MSLSVEDKVRSQVGSPVLLCSLCHTWRPVLLSVEDKGKVSGRFICSSFFIVSHLETSVT